jgi:hypothetical protein
MPALMLRYRAAAFFARLYAPDITLGMMTSDEAIDTPVEREVTPAKIPTFLDAPPVRVEPKQAESETLTLSGAPPSALEVLAARLNEGQLTWQQVAKAAEEGGIFLDVAAPASEQPEDVLTDILSLWPQLVAGLKGGVK